MSIKGDTLGDPIVLSIAMKHFGQTIDIPIPFLTRASLLLLGFTERSKQPVPYRDQGGRFVL